MKKSFLLEKVIYTEEQWPKKQSVFCNYIKELCYGFAYWSFIKYFGLVLFYVIVEKKSK